MPSISRFFGIVISMYFLDRGKHSAPHFHARYAGYEASIAIADGALLAGVLPPRQMKLVAAWVEIHRDELMQNWEICVQGRQPFTIHPLR